ncbi:EGFR-like transmembrane domain-containing protein, partial [Brachybacterium hainanense]
MPSSTRRRRLAALLLIPFVIVLAGCGRLSATFTIEDVDTMDVSMDIALEKSVAQEFLGLASPEELCEDMDSEAPGAPTTESYEEGELWGCRVSGSADPAEMEGLSLTEESGTLHLAFDMSSSGAGVTQDDVDMLTGMLGTDPFELEMIFEFPGDVLESNAGTVDGNRVTITTLDDLMSPIEITAEAGGGVPGWIIVVLIAIVLIVLFLIIVGVVVFLLIRRRRSPQPAVAPMAPAGAGLAPGGYPGAPPAAPPVPP